MKKILLIAGHNGPKTGAHGIIDEGAETIVLRDMIELTLINMGVRVVKDFESEKLANVIGAMKKMAHADDILVDIHFNASNGKAGGTETFCRKGAGNFELEMAAGLNRTVCQTLGTQSRGVKKENESQHSSLGILHCGCKSLLLEVCFCDNASDAEKYNRNRNELARNIANYLTDMINR